MDNFDHGSSVLLPIYVHYLNVEYYHTGLTCTVFVCARSWGLGLRVFVQVTDPGYPFSSDEGL